MLIKIVRERNGDIVFDENMVCSIEFLRAVYDRYGKGAVAYIVWYADIDSPFYDIPHTSKTEMLAESCKLSKVVYENPMVVNAINKYEEFILETPQGAMLAGFKKQLLAIGKLLLKEKVDMENLDAITKALKENATLPQKVSEIQKQYQDTEKEIQKYLIKGGRKPQDLTRREKKAMDEFVENKSN
jgi:hypothetical protein